uniref:GLTP domain-containing protein n=1 Tax=Globodera pallida TaxID=36090 RepID=A0A183C9M7_GLOPA
MAPIMQSPPNLRDENLNVDTSISSSHSSNLNASDHLRSFNNIVPTNASADDHSIINLDSAHNHKLKAPIEAESDDVSVGIKTLQDRLTKAAATSMDASVKQVRPVVDLSLFCLAILPSSIDKPLMQIRQAKIGDIHTQIRRMFQKNPLIDEEPTNSEKQKDKQIENSDETRAVVLFFYFRLFRKLAGFLEAPFKGGINYNENAEKSEREALLLWIIIVGKQIVNEFVSSLQTDLSLKNAEQKIKMAQFLDSIDTVKESIDMR